MMGDFSEPRSLIIYEKSLAMVFSLSFMNQQYDKEGKNFQSPFPQPPNPPTSPT